KDVCVDRLADFVLVEEASFGKTQFTDHALGCNACFFENADIRFIEASETHLSVAFLTRCGCGCEYKRIVTIGAVRGLLTQDVVRINANNGHRNATSVFLENLGHADFAAKDHTCHKRLLMWLDPAGDSLVVRASSSVIRV